jgi:hypothetical protein
VPGSVAVVCNDNANSAKPAAPWSGLPMWWCADELDTAALARSSSVHGIHSAAGHVARHAQSLSKPVSVAEASDPCVVLLGSGPAQSLALDLDTASSSVECSPTHTQTLRDRIRSVLLMQPQQSLGTSDLASIRATSCNLTQPCISTRCQFEKSHVVWSPCRSRINQTHQNMTKILNTYLVTISKGIMSQSAVPQHSASELEQCQIVPGLLLVADQDATTLG